MPRLPEAPKNTSNNEGSKRLNLSHWFWGTIVVLLAISVSLTLLATWQEQRSGTDDSSSSLDDQTVTKATLVEQWIRVAGEEAHNAASGQIKASLDKVYDEVYKNIPTYMDFHYSLTGEWLELGSAATGRISMGLEERLFPGFDKSLNKAATVVARSFDQSFQTELDKAVSAEQSELAEFRSIAHKVLGQSQDRMRGQTGPVGVVLVGGSLKVFTTTFAKKLSIKLAAKVGTKTGMKWAAATSAGGVSAAACSWTGPGAAACGVAGAAIAWVATDLASIKLDEYLTRDEFEKDLRQLIDDHKRVTEEKLLQMLAQKSLAVDAERKIVVRDIALSELKDAGRLMACQTANNLLGRYNDIRENLNARTSANLAVFRADLAADGSRSKESNFLLATWIDELTDVMSGQDVYPWILGPVILNVDFPEDLNAGRKIWGELDLAGSPIEFTKTEGSTIGEYRLEAQIEEKILLQGKARLRLELVQDRGWTSRNQTFKFSVWLDVAEDFPEGSGNVPKTTISLMMTSELEGASMPQVEVVMFPEAAMLPGRDLPEFCSQSFEVE